MMKIYELAGFLQAVTALLVGIMAAAFITDYRDMLIRAAYADGQQTVIMALPVDVLGKIHVSERDL